MTKVWCVRHRDGWCAVLGNTEPEEGSWWVPTVCGDGSTPRGITLPWGYDRRVPDCPYCLEDLGVPS